MQSKKNIVAIDANIVLRYLLKDNDELFNISEKFFNEVFNGEKVCYVFQVVLAEIIYVFTKFYKIDKIEVIEILEEFLSHKNIKIQDKDIILKSLQIFKTRNLDFVDCLLCAYSKNMQIFSFDKKLNQCINLFNTY